MERMSSQPRKQELSPEAMALQDFPPLDNEDDMMVHNWMQMIMANAHREDMTEFVEKHAGDFREYVMTHTDAYQKFRENPEATLIEIGESLYKYH